MDYTRKINDIVAKYGLESRYTIGFIELAETAFFGPSAWEAIDEAYDDLMAMDIFTIA